MSDQHQKNLIATAKNLVLRYDRLQRGGDCRAWGGEDWHKFCAKVEDLRTALKESRSCRHKNEVLIKDSETTGRVICKDCGHTREWDAY